RRPAAMTSDPVHADVARHVHENQRITNTVPPRLEQDGGVQHDQWDRGFLPVRFDFLADAALDPRMNQGLQCREFSCIGKYNAAQLAPVYLAVRGQDRRPPAPDDLVADLRLTQRLVAQGIAGDDPRSRLLREHAGNLALAAADAADQANDLW